MPEDDKRKLQLEYPCRWVYKIIGPDADSMRRAVGEIIRDRGYRISHSRSSEKGKYHCFNVELSVESEGHRKDIYECLKCHPSIKIVL
ncbi:MAG: hypothetical protein CSYNP_03373 [Syntrophus sp. SKADARSKE-3]|nr:hypothetical protein [Syntrophus sp. SKADARSKE-3]